VNCIVDVRMLAEATFECVPQRLACKFNTHPAACSVVELDARRRRLCAYLANDPIEILIALRNADKASNLADTVCVTSDYSQSRGERLCKLHGH
jgi:hypothetical protein